jgi:hypothetical protein
MFYLKILHPGGIRTRVCYTTYENESHVLFWKTQGLATYLCSSPTL